MKELQVKGLSVHKNPGLAEKKQRETPKKSLGNDGLTLQGAEEGSWVVTHTREVGTHGIGREGRPILVGFIL